MRDWRACGELEMREEDLRGRPAWLGLDLADTKDLVAIAVVVPLDDGTLATPIRVFCPEATIKRRSKRDNVPYDLWARAGFIKRTEGSVTDYAAVRAEIHRLCEFFDVREICPDPWNALQLTNELISDGLRVVKVPQSAPHISYPAKELEKRVATRRLRHGNNPVLTWCASNATVRTDAHGNIKPDKARSKERIDPVTAICNGLARALEGVVERPTWFTA